MITVQLPWPPAVLNPNYRSHWAPKAKAVRMARAHTAWLVLEQSRKKPGWAKAAISLTFCPPNKRRRDLDNLIAASKAIFDGIADAIGLDDQHFIPTFRMADPVKGGAVLVTISEAKP